MTELFEPSEREQRREEAEKQESRKAGKQESRKAGRGSWQQFCGSTLLLCCDRGSLYFLTRFLVPSQGTSKYWTILAATWLFNKFLKRS
jgi:hypothetical protein